VVTAEAQPAFPSEPEKPARVRDARIVRALKFMQDNLHRRLTVPEIAKEVGLSASRLWHLFQAETDSSPERILVQLRMERASGLLASRDAAVKHVAALVGYPCASTFGRALRRCCGTTPAKLSGSPTAPKPESRQL